MILVEGLDNTGKTTLVAQLAERYPQLQPRPSIGNKHDRKQIREAAYDEAYKSLPLMLADRSRIIAEYTYNPILQRREIAYSFDVWMRYLCLWAMKPHYVIYCWRDMDRLKETLDEREQLAGVAENLFRLNERYEQMMMMVDLLFDTTKVSQPVMHYNWEVDHPDLIHREIDKYLEGVTK